MIITLEFNHKLSPDPLPVTLRIADIQEIIDLSEIIKPVNLEFFLYPEVQDVQLELHCDRPEIRKFALTVTDIILDDFYRGKHIVYSGRLIPDKDHLNWIQTNKLYFDPDITGSNRLDFTGVLRYNFIWPFFKNIFR